MFFIHTFIITHSVNDLYLIYTSFIQDWYNFYQLQPLYKDSDYTQFLVLPILKNFKLLFKEL